MIDYIVNISNSLKDEQNKERFDEIVYNFCVVVKWDDIKLEQLGKLINKNVKEIRQIAFSYFNKVYDKYSQALYYYENLYHYCMDVDWDLEKIKEYSKRSKYRYEDILINSKKYIEARGILISKAYVQKTLEEMEYQKEYLSVLNPALLLHNIKTYSLGRTEEERRITLKYMYDKFVESEGIIGKLSSEFNLPVSRIINYVNEYAKKVIGNSLDKNKKGRKISSVKYVYDKLKKDTTLEEIIDTIESSGINPNYIREGLHSYLVGYDNYSNYHMLKGKIDLYFKYLSKKKKEENQAMVYSDEVILESSKYISMFIESIDISIEEFCYKIGLDEKAFKIHLEIVKNHNPELYEKYLEKSESNRKQRFAIIASKIRNIIFIMKNGIEENGVTRPFDLIDYFQNTSHSFSEFSKLSKEILSNQDFTLVKLFIAKNKDYERENSNFIPNILKERVEINCQTNKNGIPIPGTGEIFDNERKMRIINYLKEINVPINIKTYTLAFKRYINGMLELDEDKKIKSRK